MLGSADDFKGKLLKQVGQLNVWRRGREHALNKPLLLLLALARVAQGKPRLTLFSELDAPLTDLLMEFGPPRRSVHTSYPFCRLQNDGLWEVPGYEALPRRRESGSTYHFDVNKSVLVEHQATGGFPDQVFQMLRQDRLFLDTVVIAVLEEHFPASVHDDILERVQLPVSSRSYANGANSILRSQVMSEYGRRCAICGYDVCVGNRPFGLDVTFIKWRQAGGPETIDNAMPFCLLHRKAFDRGFMSIDGDLRVLVCKGFKGSCGIEEQFFAYASRPVLLPEHTSSYPRKEYLAWHRNQLFRSDGWV